MNKGFTLLEVLIALVILGIALIPLITAEERSQGAYITLNAIGRETILARDVMSKILYYPNQITALDKKGEVEYDKNYGYTEKIKAASYPGIFLVEVDVFKKGYDPKTGIVLKSLAK